MPVGRLVVCVPARNEAERLPRLLTALATQTVRTVAIVVSLNNTTDHSRDVIADVCSRHPGLDVVVDEVTFAPADAHAGSARRRVMDAAADIAGPDGLLLTTDADARPPQNWVAENITAMSRGMDIVGGRIFQDHDEPVNAPLAALCARADDYWAQVRAIEDAIDPVAWDPPPRHGDHTGASLCITTAAYRRCGGVPAIRSGEDRMLVKAVLRQGGRLAHPVEIWTRVSPRLVGRATGGMADHMRRLHEICAAAGDVMLPSFAQWRERAEWRREIRAQGGSALIAELEDDLPPMRDDFALDAFVLGPAA